MFFHEKELLKIGIGDVRLPQLGFSVAMPHPATGARESQRGML